MRLSRTAGTAALAAATLLLATACSSASTASTAPSGSAAATDTPTAPVTLTMWGTYGRGGNSAQADMLLNTVIPAFEAAHPNITVNYVDQNYDSLLQKLTTGAAGGTLPDLVRADIGWVPKLGALGVLAPLDQLMPDFQKLAGDTYPGILATNKWQDHYYGLPLDTNTRVLMTNPTALKAAGLSKPPATFDELKADAAAFKAKGISVFADGGTGGWNVLPWIWSAGGDITSPDLTKASGYLDSPASVAGIQLLADLYQQKAIPNLMTGNKGATGTSDGMPKGMYANILDGPWMFGIWKGQYPTFKPIVSPMPAGPGGSISVVGGEDIVIPASSPNQQAAAEFVRFSQSADYQLNMAKTGQVAVVQSLAAQESADEPYLAPFIDQLKTAKARPPVPSFPKIDDALSNYVAQALEGKMTVQAALTAAAQEIDGLLAQTS
jgi:multiple sugar transport system substrate-binding protein